MLENKVVVITGGAGLIGHSFVEAIVENNGTAIIADIDEKLGSEIENKYNNTRVEFVKLDITSKDSLNDSIDFLHKKFGKIDAVVNNAYPRNKNFGRSFFDVEYEDFCENINLNIGGYFLTSQQFAKYFQKQGYGNIINIASIYGVVAPRFEIYNGTKMTIPPEYAAIKSSLIHLTKFMAKSFKGMNIKVNAISPGGVLDNQPEVFLSAYKEKCLSKGMLDGNDLKGTLVYLLSDMSRYINGQNIILDDGFSL